LDSPAAAHRGDDHDHEDRDALSVLKKVFGYASFRGPQADIIDHVTHGGDSLVLMPTGGGKSMCYQIPSLLRRGPGIVVSPLIALMQDQVSALKEAGVAAAFLNSSQTAAESAAIERALLAGEIDIAYVAPERLMTGRFLNLLERLQEGPGLALFAIDEAHCVSQWGHDFRPEYIQLSMLHERFPSVPRIALTATADPQTRAEIVERLGLSEARIFVSSFDRPNIRYRIVEKNDARMQLLRFLRNEHPGESGIVYCLSRRKVDETAAWLMGEGITALPYHAGMDAADRAANQARFLREERLIMVATIAFGMGIDKPDVRFVAHLDLPKSVEAYYQETGRAGRDGEPADAWMVYGLGDVVNHRRMIEQSEAEDQFKRVAGAKLDALLGLCESTTCRRVRLLDYFGEASAPCGNCDVCLEPPEVWDGTEAARKALSCVFRSGQRFGAVHVIDILLGKDGERMQKWGHAELSTFGIGRDIDEKTWRGVPPAGGAGLPAGRPRTLRLAAAHRSQPRRAEGRTVCDAAQDDRREEEFRQARKRGRSTAGRRRTRTLGTPARVARRHSQGTLRAGLRGVSRRDTGGDRAPMPAEHGRAGGRIRCRCGQTGTLRRSDSEPAVRITAERRHTGTTAASILTVLARSFSTRIVGNGKP
jgi:ATP-dependent DNA helicase RecQ